MYIRIALLALVALQLSGCMVTPRAFGHATDYSDNSPIGN